MNSGKIKVELSRGARAGWLRTSLIKYKEYLELRGKTVKPGDAPTEGLGEAEFSSQGSAQGSIQALSETRIRSLYCGNTGQSGQRALDMLPPVQTNCDIFQWPFY